MASRLTTGLAVGGVVLAGVFAWQVYAAVVDMSDALAPTPVDEATAARKERRKARREQAEPSEVTAVAEELPVRPFATEGDEEPEVASVDSAEPEVGRTIAPVSGVGVAGRTAASSELSGVPPTEERPVRVEPAMNLGADQLAERRDKRAAWRANLSEDELAARKKKMAEKRRALTDDELALKQERRRMRQERLEEGGFIEGAE